MILVAPTSFKGTIGAAEAARALAAGARDALPGIEVVELPLSDGGPGLIDAIRTARGGDLLFVGVRDPLGRPARARILLADLDDGRAAIVESADACGMHLLARAELDPMRASSEGVGELVEAASRHADRVVLGLGGSATVDGGVGMARALGWRFLDDAGRDLDPGGAALRRLAHVRAPSARTRPRVVALADVISPLTGPLGAARVFGPQKGASAADVELLDAGLSRLAEIVQRDVGIDAAALPGAGAAGGLGFGSVAFLGASLARGSNWLLDAVGFDALLARATLVVTGEGSYDAQSSLGKVTGEVIGRAARAGVPVLLVAGRVEGAPPAGVAVATRAGSLLAAAELARLAEENVRTALAL
ncbi:MAG TPA: glycerate kinase [Longimicrobiales bacterium]